jgi:hypothetical protein
MKMSFIALSNRHKAILIGVIGGITYSGYYALKQFPPYYLPSLFPLGEFLFFLLIGAMGAFAAGEFNKATRAARYGAWAGVTAGVMLSVILIILHNYAKHINGSGIDFSPLLGYLEYYVVVGGMLTAMIAAVTLALGAAGAFVFSCIAQFVDTTVHFRQHRR